MHRFQFLEVHRVISVRSLPVLALACLFCCSGCSKIKDLLPTNPTPNPAPVTAGAVYYTAVSASDGLGIGGTNSCFIFDSACPNGTGWVQIINRRLTAAGREVNHLNLSIPGAVLSRTIEDLSRTIGRIDVPGNFIERESPFVQTAATVVTVWAGGNDANIIGTAARTKGGNDVNGYVDGQVRQWGTDLEDLITRIRARSANTRIVALNLPNLAASPYLAANPVDEKRIMQRVAVGLTDRVNALTAKGVLVVDLMCEPRLLQSGNYASDGFHPNDNGYSIIADLAYPAVLNGTSPSPSSSCSQRSIY
jgi:lysophospholipase L1-like esterase